MGKRQQFTQPFKVEAVRLLERGDNPRPMWPGNWVFGGISCTSGRRRSELMGITPFPATGAGPTGRRTRAAETGAGPGH